MPDTPMIPTSIGGGTADWLEWGGWHRENATTYAQVRDRSREHDFHEVKKHVLHGWLPEKPFISKDKVITAFGSCFAYHVEGYLRHRGYRTSTGQYGQQDASNYWSNSLLIKCAEGFVNTWSLLYQLEWLLEGSEPEIEIWAKMDGRVRRYLDNNRDAGRRMLDETDVFIMTLGLSEAWYRKADGRVLWAGVPQSLYDPEKFGFRQTTVTENLANLDGIVGLLRKHRGDVPIIFTLSPVPLMATFRPVSCISANSVSKAVLRVAVDELIRARTDDKALFYFPSYEIVKDYLRQPFDDGNLHHPTFETIHTIMEAFLNSYCVSDLDAHRLPAEGET
jgi:hypothetical protein